jgi:VanZ family protein
MPLQPSDRRSRHAALLWAGLICWAALILGLSSLPPRELPDAAFAFWDKANHFLAYMLGGWLAASALRASRPGRHFAGNVVGAVIVIALFGVVDEAVQTLTPGRTGADPDDWIADVLGAAAGALLTLSAREKTPRT